MNRNTNFKITKDVIEECLEECLDKDVKTNRKEKTSYVSKR